MTQGSVKHPQAQYGNAQYGGKVKVWKGKRSGLKFD